MQKTSWTHNIFNKSSQLLFKARIRAFVLFLILFQLIFIDKALSYGFLPECSSGIGLLPRETCKDLIDMPLCLAMQTPRTINPADIEPIDRAIVNCVKECSDTIFNNPDVGADPANVRGVNYAVHNRHCIRFCPSNGANYVVESGESVNITPGLNCVAKKCHQLSKYDTPISGTNCEILGCSLLTIDELKEGSKEAGVKFFDQTKRYCEADKKCYDFSASELQYLRYRTLNPMCKIHDCAPLSTNCVNGTCEQVLSPTCNAGVNDGVNVTNKNAGCPSGNSTCYENGYKTFIDPGFNSDTSRCKPLNCKAILYRTHGCLSGSTGNTSNPTILNSNCDTTLTDSNGASSPQQCTTEGYCVQKIDCNSAANKSEPECAPTPPDSYTDNANYDNGYAVKSWFYRPGPLSRVNWNKVQNRTHDVCYSMDNLEDSGWGERWLLDFGLLGTLDMGYFHYIWDDERSPGHCDATKTGTRGTGYIYLCGTGGNLYSEPDWDVGYNDGYVQANYESDTPSYSIKTCLRYKNTLRLGACGRRVCGIFCEFNQCRTQMCGWDRCRTLTIYDDNEKGCSNPDKSSGDCDSQMGGGASVDSYVRVRAAKYGRKICTFLDLKGTLAYDPDYMKGDAALGDGTCIDGSKDANGICQGYDSNSDPGLAHVWRSIMMIPHVSGSGYTDLQNRDFRGQECAYIPLRIGPPKLYKISNISNSLTLFAPPLWTSAIKVIRGGVNATDGKTDFHEPEIEVTFGESNALLSLSPDKIGNEAQKEETSEAQLETQIGPKTYLASVFIKKEFSDGSNSPILCLYRTQRSAEGQISDKKITCVDRRKPEIDSVIAGRKRKTLITGAPANNYKNSTLRLQMMVSAGGNNVDDNCLGDDECSKTIFFNYSDVNHSCSGSSENKSAAELDLCSRTKSVNYKQSDPTQEICLNNIEKHKICAKKETCSKLVDVCISNSIKLTSLHKNDPEYIALSKDVDICNSTLLYSCNALWGIVGNSTISNISDLIIDMDTTTLRPKSADQNAYGWFHEICLSKGFESKLTNVVSYIALNGTIKGKCLIDGAVPGVNINNCQNGGNAANNCPCLNSQGFTIQDLALDPAQYTIRAQTPREAGLCVDIPLPKICPAISYQKNVNNTSDINFSIHSLDKNTYNNSSGVHTTHRDRTIDSANVGHGEFNTVFSGVDAFEGQCNGFWKEKTRPSGTKANPTMNCKLDGTWDTANVINPCERYSCPTRSTSGMFKTIDGSGSPIGVYLGEYAIGESGVDQGLRNGFANWNFHTKTNDFLEEISATSCIVGFKTVNGNIPTRDCNQLGRWLAVENQCERITCPALNPPTSPTTQSDYDQWIDSGGAIFPAANASRSTTQIIGDVTTVTGECYDNGSTLRFFKSSNGDSPTRSCNHLGQWGVVKNPCVTSCDAISTQIGAISINNGFAYWKKAENVPINGSVNGELDSAKGFQGCVSGYKPSPYSPKDQTNIFNEGGAVTRPIKKCTSVATSNNTNRSIWESAENSCIDYCPGEAEDPRIGVGKTVHNIKLSGVNTQITLGWAKTAFGGIAIRRTADAYNAGFFNPNRVKNNNHHYLLTRKCGYNGKWKEVAPACSINSGEIENSTYQGSNHANQIDQNSGGITIGGLIIAGSDEDVTGKCTYGYINKDIFTTEEKEWGSGTYYAWTQIITIAKPGSDPKRKCVFKDDNKNINEVSLQLSDPTQGCEEVLCVALLSQTFNSGGLKYTGDTHNYKIDQKINLPCSGSNISNGGAMSTATCNGNRGWTINNTGCRRGNPCHFNWWSGHANASGCGGGDGSGFGPLSNVRHGETINWSIYDKCGGDCRFHDLSEKCNDGEWMRRASIGHSAWNTYLWGRGQCWGARYNWDSSKWEGVSITYHHGAGIMHYSKHGVPNHNRSNGAWYYNNDNQVVYYGHSSWD